MKDIKLIELNETDSTNRFLREYTGDEGKILTVATAEYQTSGHGTGANIWESGRGENLLFSIMFRPNGLHVSRQFEIIETIAVVVRDVLGERADEVTIKWPNDIYWRERKVAGILSECDVSGGAISRCIVGVGVNVNQTEFRSDAPNPVSLRQICGTPFNRKVLLDDIIRLFAERLKCLGDDSFRQIRTAYLQHLYRKTGVHEFEDDRGRFNACIVTVEEDGHLILRREDGTERKYAFKEVKFLTV